MIEFRDPKKRFWLKTIASFLVVTFVWYDIAWAGDLFYAYGRPVSASADTHKIPEPKVTQVTNYDLLEYNKKQSPAEKLLPSNREREQTNSFSPGYIQEQQIKHEDIIKQNGGKIAGVSKKLSYLVVGTDAGLKQAKAEQLGVQCISESELMNMIK